MKNGLDKKIRKETDKLHQERLDEIVPVAREVIKLIAEANLEIGDTNAHDNDKLYAVAHKILATLLKKNIKYSDRQFVFQLVLQPFDRVREVVSQSLDKSFDKALNRSFGKDFLELRLEDIDKMLGIGQ